MRIFYTFREGEFLNRYFFVVCRFLAGVERTHFFVATVVTKRIDSIKIKLNKIKLNVSIFRFATWLTISESGLSLLCIKIHRCKGCVGSKMRGLGASKTLHK